MYLFASCGVAVNRSVVLCKNAFPICSPFSSQHICVYLFCCSVSRLLTLVSLACCCFVRTLYCPKHYQIMQDGITVLTVSCHYEIKLLCNSKGTQITCLNRTKYYIPILEPEHSLTGTKPPYMVLPAYSTPILSRDMLLVDWLNQNKANKSHNKKIQQTRQQTPVMYSQERANGTHHCAKTAFKNNMVVNKKQNTAVTRKIQQQTTPHTT